MLAHTYDTQAELMTESNDYYIYRDFFADYLDDLFHHLVEERSIEIGNKTADELYVEFRKFLKENAPIYEKGEEVAVAFDYRDDLLTRADQEGEGGHYALALTLYAIWLEHKVNGLLIIALGNKGYAEEVIKPLIRELKLKTKMSSLWTIAGLTPFDPEAFTLANRISDRRNAFVHYKWVGYTETARERLTSEESDLVNAAKVLTRAIADIESHDFWNGRKQNVVAEIRARIASDLKG